MPDELAARRALTKNPLLLAQAETERAHIETHLDQLIAFVQSDPLEPTEMYIGLLHAMRDVPEWKLRAVLALALQRLAGGGPS